jgi:hypothetical protein
MCEEVPIQTSCLQGSHLLIGIRERIASGSSRYSRQSPPAMKLKRVLLRYYPPGIILEYELRDGTREMKEIDLLHLTAEYDVPLH